MIITAKFESVCPCCQSSIAVGSRVEWERGSKARHETCAGKPAATSTTTGARTSSSSSRGGRRWYPCGYPGCNPHYCDECDGRGGHRFEAGY